MQPQLPGPRARKQTCVVVIEGGRLTNVFMLYLLCTDCRLSSETHDESTRRWILQGKICAVLASLARSDLNASQIRENNGVYVNQPPLRVPALVAK